MEKQKEEKQKSITQLKNSIDKMASEQDSLEKSLQAIREQLKAVKKSKADLKREMDRAQKKKDAAERRKNRALRNRCLLEAAEALLDELPVLRDPFDSSVSKEDYLRNGQRLKEQFVNIAQGWKTGHKMNVDVPKDAPSTSSDKRQAPAKKESENSAPRYDFEALNEKRPPADFTEIAGKHCPQCGAPIFAWIGRDNKEHYCCGNSSFWNFGKGDCDFHPDDLNKVPDTTVK